MSYRFFNINKNRVKHRAMYHCMLAVSAHVVWVSSEPSEIISIIGLSNGSPLWLFLPFVRALQRLTQTLSLYIIILRGPTLSSISDNMCDPVVVFPGCLGPLPLLRYYWPSLSSPIYGPYSCRLALLGLNTKCRFYWGGCKMETAFTGSTCQCLWCTAIHH